MDESDRSTLGATGPVTPLGPAAEVPALQPGQVLLGRFEILEVLGRGGMGVVYAALDRELAEKVALKTLRPELASDEGALARFRREVHLARRVTHPGICRVFDLFRVPADSPVAPGGVFLTMEFLAGETLAARLARQGPLPHDEARRVADAMASALAAAHAAGVVHRDFKSGNVMLSPGEGGPRVVVTDFGLARGLAGDHHAAAASQDGRVLGTPAYVAPEQLLGETAGPRADVYALGVVLYEMLTGRLPFEGDTPASVALQRLRTEPLPLLERGPRLDMAWQPVVMACLSRQPEDRPASAEEVLRSLRAFERPSRTPRRLALLASAAVLVAVALLWLAARRPAAPAGAVARPTAEARPAVAVLGFRDLSPRAETAWLATALSELVLSEVAADGRARVVPGETVALSGLSAPAAAGGLDPAALARARVNLSADWLVLGTYLAVGQGDAREVRLDVRLQRAATGEVTALAPQRGRERDLLDLVSRLGTAARERIGLGAGRAATGPVLPADPEAARDYAVALERLRRSEVRAAMEALERVVAREPDFPHAQAALAWALSDLGYRARASEAAERARRLAQDLPGEQRLLVEGRLQLVARDWRRAIETFTALRRLHPDDLEHGLALARAQTKGDRAREALETVAALRKLPGGQGDDPRVDLVEADASKDLPDYERLVAAAGRAEKAGRERGAPLVVAAARYQLGWARHAKGDAPSALAAMREAEALYLEAGDRTGAAHVANAAAIVVEQQGHPVEALQAYRRALAVFRETGDRDDEALLLSNAADTLCNLGRLAEATRMFDEALAAAREIADQDLLGLALNASANALRRQGRLAEARRRNEEALAVGRAIGPTVQEVWDGLEGLGFTLLAQGDLAAARAAFEEGLRVCEGVGEKAYAARMRHGLGLVATAQGKPEEARPFLQAALAARLEVSEPLTAAETRTALAALALAEGRAGEAEEPARAAAESARSLGFPDREAAARALLARAHAGLGDCPAAVAAAEEALRLVASGEVVDARIEARVDAGRALAACSRPTEGRRALLSARTEAERLGFAGAGLAAELGLAEIEAGTPAGRAALGELARRARWRGHGGVAAQAERAAGRGPGSPPAAAPAG